MSISQGKYGNVYDKFSWPSRQQLFLILSSLHVVWWNERVCLSVCPNLEAAGFVCGERKQGIDLRGL